MLRIALATLGAVGPLGAGGLLVAGALGRVPGHDAPASALPLPWSSPAELARCAPDGRPEVVFPQSGPSHATGAGAMVFNGPKAICESAGARPRSASGAIRIAPIGALDRPGPPTTVASSGGSALHLAGDQTVAASGTGRIVIGAGLGPDASRPGSSGRAVLTEARAPGPFPRPLVLEGSAVPMATATAYLGDVAIATVAAAERRAGSGSAPAPRVGPRTPVAAQIVLRIQRYRARSPGPPVRVAIGPGRVTALAVALDYRSDALVAWAQGGQLYAHWLPASGRPQRTQRVGPSRPYPQLQALISDDNRAIVAWTSAAPTASLTRTHVYTNISGPLVRFGEPRLLEALTDPAGPLPAGSVRLIRLSTEGVMMAWTGIRAGRHVVRAAAVALTGVRRPTLVSDPGLDSVLADLQPGPRAEALALWVARAKAASRRRSPDRLQAARGVNAAGQARFDLPETIDGPGPRGRPRIALDPATDRAVAVWVTPASAIEFSVRRPGAGQPQAPARAAGSGIGVRR